MTAVEYDLEVPVWWDKKARKWIWDHTTFRLGLLLVRGDTLTVASVRGIICSARFDELRAEWPGTFELPVCDLFVRGERFRFFFCAPHPRSPQFHARIPTAVSVVMETRTGDRVRLASAKTPAARWPSQLTEPMGRKRMEALRHTIEKTGALPDKT